MGEEEKGWRPKTRRTIPTIHVGCGGNECEVFPPTTEFGCVLSALLLLGSLLVISAKGRVWTDISETFLAEGF